MTKIAVFLLVAQSANSASINYTFELDATLTLDGTPTVLAVPIIISGTGDTDNIFSIDATRIANAFDATIVFGGSS
ncbi:hypothetical protein C1J03_10810 [Sulfitobacter sp. SK012]|nr:hypothetical protein C1J03_10810 [Sulfitobacter sp. SK012]